MCKKQLGCLNDFIREANSYGHRMVYVSFLLPVSFHCCQMNRGHAMIISFVDTRHRFSQGVQVGVSTTLSC